MSPEQMKTLKRGDIIRHNAESHALVVDANFGSFVVAVRSQHVSNPAEWDLIDYQTGQPVEGT